jgi:hypothetical protein
MHLSQVEAQRRSIGLVPYLALVAEAWAKVRCPQAEVEALDRLDRPETLATRRKDRYCWPVMRQRQDAAHYWWNLKGWKGTFC